MTGEDAKRLLHTDRYNERSLHYMGYHKVDDRWVSHESRQKLVRSNTFIDDDGDGDDEDDDTSIDGDEESMLRRRRLMMTLLYLPTQHRLLELSLDRHLYSQPSPRTLPAISTVTRPSTSTSIGISLE